MNKSFKTFLKHTAKDFHNQSVNPPVLAPISIHLLELTSTSVPQNIASRHTQLTNSVSQLAAATDNLLLEEQDELVTLSLVAQLETILSNAASAIININKYFDIIANDTYFSSIE